MPKTIPCRKVYQFRMEPTELEALELERTASVARYAYNWRLERCFDPKAAHYEVRSVNAIAGF